MMQRKAPMLLGTAYEYPHRGKVILMAWAAMIILLTTCPILISTAGAVDNREVGGANGTLHVYGALTESPCSLEMTTDHQEVSLGETGTAHLQHPGDRGKPVAFELILKDCLRAPSSNRDVWTGVLAWNSSQPAVSVAFWAPKDDDAPGLFKVSGVAGLGLLLTEANGLPVRLGVPNKPVLLTPGQNTLTYQVIPVRTPAMLRAGSYRAAIDFRLYYD